MDKSINIGIWGILQKHSELYESNFFFSILTEEEEYFYRLFVKQELLQNIFVHEAYHQNWRDTANKTK